MEEIEEKIRETFGTNVNPYTQPDRLKELQTRKAIIELAKEIDKINKRLDEADKWIKSL